MLHYQEGYNLSLLNITNATQDSTAQVTGCEFLHWHTRMEAGCNRWVPVGQGGMEQHKIKNVR